MTSSEIWNLFAIHKGKDPSIRRVALSRAVQSEIVDLFDRQRQSWQLETRDEIELDLGYTPDESEIFAIGGYEMAPEILEAAGNPVSVEVLGHDSEQLSSISGIFLSNHDKSEILFQTFDRRQVISPKGFTLIHSGNTFRRMEQSGFTFANKLAAVFVQGKLFFESFYAARKVLDLTEELNEATDERLRDFCSSDLLSADAEALSAMADSWVRKKISSILRLGTLEAKKKRLEKTGRSFGVQLEYDGDGRLKLPGDKKSLKEVLRLLDDSYFQSGLTDNKYISNSKRKLK